MFKLPSSLPLCVGEGCYPRFWCRGFLAPMSLKRYVLEIYSGPPAWLAFEVFWAQYLALAAVWSYMYAPDHVFYPLDRPLTPSSPKVSTIILLVACKFRKRLVKQIKIEIAHSDEPFCSPRCDFVMLSKPITKLVRKLKLCTQSNILCTRSRL